MCSRCITPVPVVFADSWRTCANLCASFSMAALRRQAFWAAVFSLCRATHLTAILSVGSTPAAESSSSEYRAYNMSASYMIAEPQKAGSAITDGDLQCLSELPVDKLLRIRKTLRYVSHMLEDGHEDKAKTSVRPSFSMAAERRHIGPIASARRQLHYRGDGYPFEMQHGVGDAHAAPLMMDHIKEKVGYEDGGGGSSYGWVEEKPSKVQKIFQMSVTTLAFLAFGGYLLCMIVQAIKSKGTTYYHPALMPMMMMGTGEEEPAALGSISQISIRKRRPVRIKRRASTPSKSAAQSAAPSPDELYNVLVQAAERYVQLSAMQ